MSRRQIISIDQDRCSGCGQCIPNCPEGALQLIDGKARLVSDLFCDGLGACIGHCPEGAIEIIERDAEPYDESRVMAAIAAQGANTIRAHLDHLEAHGEMALHSQALAFLREKGIPIPEKASAAEHAGCPGMRARTPKHAAVRGLPQAGGEPAQAASQLGNWPIQMHLVSPLAPHFAGTDVLLSADCVAFAVPDFHARFLAGRTLAIACPKLDEGTQVYRDKIVALIEHARINTLTVVMMEVPCCRGLLAIAEDAVSRASRRIPLKAVIVGIDDGAILEEEWISGVPEAARRS